MKLLVLGGTAFLGRAVVDAAVAQGHEVTTFNRGRSGPDHAGAAAVRGDRRDPADLAALASHGSFDAVIDTSPQVPRDVLASARALGPVVARYVLVTSVSVNPGWPAEPIGATSPVFDCPPDAGPDDGHYGELKAGCERAAAAILGSRCVPVRPGVILGPHENVGRLPWWLRRFAAGGRVLVPDRPDAPFQAVDVRDLADLLVAVAMAAQPPQGPVVAVGPAGRDTYDGWLALARSVAGPSAEPVPVAEAFLVEQGLGEWDELPLWVPDGPDMAHAYDVDGSTGQAAGLACRPLADTVADTWAWLRDSVDYPVPERIGLDPVKERLVLSAWADRA